MTHPTDSTGFTLGGVHGATLGGSTGGTYGNQPGDAYRIRLTAPDGRRTDLTALEDISVVREVSAISDMEVSIPRGPDLSEFAFADMDLFYKNELLFQAVVEELPGPGTAPEGTLAGRGVGRRLARRELSVDYDGVTDHVAIQDAWSQTVFSATVTPPNSPGTITLETSGTALDVLQKLHEQAGMEFVIRHDEPGYVAESFVPSENVRTASWTRVDDDSGYDLRDYANKVIVNGKLKSDGTRPRATAEDTAEINAAGREIEWIITDPELTTTAACQQRADVELAKRTAEDSLSGTIEIIPQRVTPGFYYAIPAWDDVELPITKVEYRIARGDAIATLAANSAQGLNDFLAALGRQSVTTQRLV